MGSARPCPFENVWPQKAVRVFPVQESIVFDASHNPANAGGASLRILAGFGTGIGLGLAVTGQGAYGVGVSKPGDLGAYWGRASGAGLVLGRLSQSGPAITGEQLCRASYV